MPLIDPQGWLVTAAPGTGSTSLLSAVSARPGVRRVPDADVEDGSGRQLLDAKHATAAQLVDHGLLPPDHGLVVVTGTRNPFDFYVAEWSRTRTRWVQELRDPGSWVHRQAGAIDRIVDALTHEFEPWLEVVLEPELSSGSTRRLNRGHVDEADVVVRMEHLQADLDRAGLGVTVGHLNSSRRSTPYWVHYSAEARAWIEAVHRPDLDRFGYAF